MERSGMLTRARTPARRRFLAIRLLVGLGLISLVACAAPVPSPSAVPSGLPVTVVGANASLRVTLTLEEPPRNDAITWASVTIENIADRGVRWAGGGCGDWGATFIDLSKAFAFGRLDWPGRLGSFKKQAIAEPDAGGN